MRPVSGRLAGTSKAGRTSRTRTMHYANTTPRHLTRPRRPWRLLLFVFGLTTAVLAALVASATLLPQPEPPRRVPGVALSPMPTKPAPTSASTTTTAPREPTTAFLLPPHPTLGGEPSADRPRPPDRPRPKRRPLSVARQPPRRLPLLAPSPSPPRPRHRPRSGPLPPRHRPRHCPRPRCTTTSVARPASHPTGPTTTTGPTRRRADHDRPTRQRPRPDQRTCPAANQQTSRPRPSVRYCPSWVCCTCCGGWFHRPAGPTPGGAAPTTPAAPADPPGRQAGGPAPTLGSLSFSSGTRPWP